MSAGVAVYVSEAEAHRVGSPCSAESFLNLSSPLEPPYFLISEDNVDQLPRLSSGFFGLVEGFMGKRRKLCFGVHLSL